VTAQPPCALRSLRSLTADGRPVGPLRDVGAARFRRGTRSDRHVRSRGRL